MKAPEDILGELIPELSSKCEFIVLLAHADINEAKVLAKTFPQIDVIIVGDEQADALREPISVADTVLLNPGIKGKALGRLDIRWDKGEESADSHFELLTLSERIPDSPRMTDLLFMYQQMLAAENLSEEVERELPSTGGMYAGNASCKTCHASEYASWKKQSILTPITRLLKRGMKTIPSV